jgi:uncharacterized protein (TIGR02217 family)
MPIEVLTDIVLPENVIRAGIAGKNMRNNTRSISGSGFASVNVNWSRTLRQFELGIKPMGIEEWHEIEALHEVTEGGAYGFLIQDPKDSTVDAADGFLIAQQDGLEIGTIGAGYGVPAYRLRKKYTAMGGTRFNFRPITRPKLAITVRRNNSDVTIGTAAGNASVNYDTGTVTFVPDATQAIQTITTGSTTVLEFADDTGMVAAMATSGRVYITGVSGTAATALNGKSHLVLSKLENTITIQTNTATLAATGGTAAKYPQPNDALRWAGQFYVPVHFANDEIDWDLMLGGIEEGRIVAGQSVVLQEIRE